VVFLTLIVTDPHATKMFVQPKLLVIDEVGYLGLDHRGRQEGMLAQQIVLREVICPAAFPVSAGGQEQTRNGDHGGPTRRSAPRR
jgi:hypothetical protein